MSPAEFTEAMLKLKCGKQDATHVLRLIFKLMQRYSWMSRDELYATALEAVPRAQETYDKHYQTSEGKSTKFTTWLVSIVRNALRSQIKREERNRSRFTVTGTVEVGVYDEGSDVAHRDELQLLSRVLSPLAWRLLQMGLSEAPRRVSNKAASSTLNLSLQSVVLLRKEIQAAGKRILMNESGKVEEK